MKFLGWDSDYIINKRLYLKEDYTITVAGFSKDGSVSNIHTNLEISEFLEILSSPTNHELLFRYGDKCWVYWGDMTIFIPNKCYTKSEYRERRLLKLLG